MAGGPPERWRILLEGESLLNDASSITLFTIFIQFAIDAAQGHPLSDTAGQIIMNVLQKTAWLTAGKLVHQKVMRCMSGT
jgi:NhaP-type Na+/H+ or K+/H+ antiporter